ncbi:MAG: MFS transporter [Gammaproteobacteria bacterium]|nr:MFS transporter [Gammaproteobacteria bacterium]
MLDRSPQYSWWIVGLLLLISLIGYLDRLVLSFLIDPIKADLGLSDTDMGVLSGMAFALFYVLMGVPMGRWVDTRNRRNLLAGCVALWSVMTAACGAAISFTTLFLARVGVGIGEAALNPAAVSMIGDLFPREKIARPLGIFSLGVYLGGGVALMLGGEIVARVSELGALEIPVIGAVAPWRAVFLLVGAPGLAAALLLLLTAREPRVKREVVHSAPSWREVLGFAQTHRRFFAPLFLGLVAFGFNIYSILGWYPAMLMRTYGVSPAEVAWSYGVVYLIAGVAGGVSVGWVIEWLHARSIGAAPVTLCMVSMVVMLLTSAVAPLLPTITACVAVTALTVFVWALTTSAAYATLVQVLPERMRGVGVGFYMVIMNVTGGAFGTVIVGLLCDHVFGAAGLRYALVAMAAVALPVSVLAFARARTPYHCLASQPA